MFEQRIIDNDDDRFPAGSVLIVGLLDGVEVSWSWAPADIDPAIRLSSDHPIAADDRTDTKTTTIEYREPTADERAQIVSIFGEDAR